MCCVVGYRSKSPNGCHWKRAIVARRRRSEQADTMIALFTDFGLHGPYTGQMKAVLHQMVPGIPIIDLFADAPVGNLLAAYAAWFPERTVFLCVVDPGVGWMRPSLFIDADRRWYLSPATG